MYMMLLFFLWIKLLAILLDVYSLKSTNGQHALFLQFYPFLSSKVTALKMDPKFLDRNVNEGFSGGEKKRNEILQLAVGILVSFYFSLICLDILFEIFFPQFIGLVCPIFVSISKFHSWTAACMVIGCPLLCWMPAGHGLISFKFLMNQAFLISNYTIQLFHTTNVYIFLSKWCNIELEVLFSRFCVDDWMVFHFSFSREIIGWDHFNSKYSRTLAESI